MAVSAGISACELIKMICQVCQESRYRVFWLVERDEVCGWCEAGFGVMAGDAWPTLRSTAHDADDAMPVPRLVCSDLSVTKNSSDFLGESGYWRVLESTGTCALLVNFAKLSRELHPPRQKPYDARSRRHASPRLPSLHVRAFPLHDMRNAG